MPKPSKHFKYHLKCRLTEWHKTDEGDFIPAGTPVTVLGWSDEDEGMLDVQCAAYVFAGDDHRGDRPSPCVGTGLHFTADPALLTYAEHWERRVLE